MGNADTAQFPHRELVALGMDARGRVKYGDVGAGLLKSDASLPYLYTTDPARLYQAFDQVKQQADVVIVDLGETSRAAEYAPLMPPEAAAALRKQALERADKLLGGLLARLDTDRVWRVLVLTPTPPASTPDHRFAPLTPIIFSQPGKAPGLLTSPSTRRAGLVVNTDLAATLLTDLGVAIPTETVGRPITSLPTPEAKTALLRDLVRHDTLETARRQIFRAFSSAAMIALWLGALLLFAGGLAPRWTRILARGFLLVLLSVPAAALLEARLPLALPAAAVVGAVIALALLLALLARLVTRHHAAEALAAFTVALLSYDLLAGQALLERSTFSYSVASGARFYGLGNEYGGVLLGATLVAVGGLLRLRKPTAGRREGRLGRLLITAVLMILAGLVGGSRFGANFGIALGCAVGFVTFLIYLWRERPSWTDIGLVGLVMLLVGVAVVAVDLLASRSGGASHIGLLLANLRAEGWSALADVIVRKFSMNWLLLRISTWTDVALAAAVVLGVAAIFKPPAILAAAARRPWLTPSLFACLAGAATALLLNDSGIVAAAITLFYGAGSLAYVGLGEERAS